MSLNPTQAADELRKLAARIEAAGFCEESRVSVSIDCHGVDDTAEMRKWLRLMGPKCHVQPEVPSVVLYDWGTDSNVRVAVFPTNELLDELFRASINAAVPDVEFPETREVETT